MSRRHILADLHDFKLDPAKPHKLHKDRLCKRVETKVTEIINDVMDNLESLVVEKRKDQEDLSYKEVGAEFHLFDDVAVEEVIPAPVEVIETVATIEDSIPVTEKEEPNIVTEEPAKVEEVPLAKKRGPKKLKTLE